MKHGLSTHSGVEPRLGLGRGLRCYHMRMALFVATVALLAGCAVPEDAEREPLTVTQTVTAQPASTSASPAAPEDVAFKADSPVRGQIHVTMIKMGSRAPYAINTADTSSDNDAVVKMDGQLCDVGPASGALRANSEFHSLTGFSDSGASDAKSWGAGEVMLFDTDCSGSTSPSSTALVSGTTHAVEVVVRGEVAFAGNVVIR